MSHLISINYQVWSQGPNMNKRYFFDSGNSKDLEVTSQELGTKASQVLYYTEMERTQNSSNNVEKEQS